MTPQGWTLDNLVLWGAAWMFGGAAIAAAFGVLMSRLRSAETGIGSGMLLWGVGNLLIAAWVALFVFVESSVLLLPPSRCVALANAGSKPMHQQFYLLPAAASAAPVPVSQPIREVSTAAVQGPCTEDARPQPEPLRLRVRVRDADVAGRRPLIDGEFVDADKPLAIIVTWSVFGGIALLIGSVMLAAGRQRQPAWQQRAAQPVEVAAWRKTVGALLGNLGLLVFLAAFIGPMFLDGSESRGLQFGFRSAAAALALWCVAALLAGTARWGGGAVMVVFVAILLGIAELIKYSN